tara:strand:+ start:202 stop:744 length:543 start_codon:yes stop_codon:yes gene_type:complete
MIRILGIFIICSMASSSSIDDKVYNKINKQFPNLKNIESSKLIIDQNKIQKIKYTINQDFYYNELHSWKITTKDNREYIAILDNVKGKSMPITFLAIFDQDNTIFNVSIIKYREPYGGEIKSKRWLKQFVGFDYSSDYAIGTKIDGISGATISTNSVSKGVNKLALLLELIHIESLSLDE